MIVFRLLFEFLYMICVIKKIKNQLSFKTYVG